MAVKKHQVPPAVMLLFSIAFGFLGGWFAVQQQSGDSIFVSSGEKVVLDESEAISAVAERVSPSVVSINVTSESRSISFFGDRVFESESEGSGVILTRSGYVVTNKHVIPESATKVTVVMYDGTSYEDVDVVGRDPFNDIAYLKINTNDDLKPAVLGDSDNVKVGDKAIAIGNALGELDTTVTAGIISGLGRPILAGTASDSESLVNLLQTDAAINPGNSGGPLVNIAGEIIGINTAVAGNAENIGFAIPINDIKAGIESVQKHGELKRPYLGISYVMLNPDIAEELDTPVEEGALITADAGKRSVLRDSPAEKAGLQDGDIILQIDGADINKDNPLLTSLSRKQVGQQVTIKVLRGEAEIELNATLEEVPSSIGD